MAVQKGGASAADKGKDLRSAAAAARASRQAGEKVKRGQSETALKKQAKAWDAGAVGEGRAQRQLDRLRREKGWVVLHDRLLAPPKQWNLDHVVAGSPGVWFVDAKNWRGDIKVSKGTVWRNWWGGPKTGRQSQKMNHEVNKVKGMAERASERLGVPVIPMICLAGARSRRFEDVAVVNGVVIISVDKVFAYLRDQPPRWGAVDTSRVQRRAEKTFPPATVDEPAAGAIDWSSAMRAGKGAFTAPAAPTAPATNAPVAPAQPTPVPEAQRGLMGRLRRP